MIFQPSPGCPSRTSLTGSPAELHEDFVRLHHADLTSGTLFDHFLAFAQVTQLGQQALVGHLGLLVFLALASKNL